MLSPVFSRIPTRKTSTEWRRLVRESICSADVNFTFGPFNNKAPGSYEASKVCLSKSPGCIMLDLPELFAPANRVSGRISILCSSLSDLKPVTMISAMDQGSFRFLGGIFAMITFSHWRQQGG